MAARHSAVAWGVVAAAANIFKFQKYLKAKSYAKRFFITYASASILVYISF